MLHFYQVYTIWGIYLKELNNDSKIKYIYFASCYIFGCAFKYVNLKTRFELKKEIKTKEKNLCLFWAISPPHGPSHPCNRLPHPISSCAVQLHIQTFVGPLLCPVSFPHKNDVWAPPVSLTSHSAYIGTECLSHRRVGHARQRLARAHALSRALAGGTPTQIRHLPSDKAEVVTKQRDRSRRDWSLARSDSTRIRLSPYLIKLTIRDPISGCVDNSKPPSSPGREVPREIFVPPSWSHNSMAVLCTWRGRG